MSAARRLVRRAAVVTVAACALVAGCGGKAHSRSATHRGSALAPAATSPTTAPAAVPASRPTEALAALRDPVAPGVARQPVALPAAARSLTPEQVPAGSQALDRQLKQAAPGSVIHLASGAYPKITDTTRHAGTVTISGAGDATKPVIAGAKLFGAQHVRFVDVAFSKRVYVSQFPIPKYVRPASDIQILDSEFDCGGHGSAIFVRAGSQNVRIAGDEVHDCTVGFSSVAQDAPSQNVSITHCTFENLYGDAIDLGGLSNVTIAGNVIRNVARRPGVEYHDDGIQFLGNTSHVRIVDNVIANVLDQLLFIQDAVKSKITHSSVNSDIQVIGNLMYGNAAIAVQDQGAVGLQFVGNTVWDSGNGSLFLRRSGYTGLRPSSTLLADNIIESVVGGHGHAREGYNVVGHATGLHDHDIHSRRPGFVSPATGNFGLTRRAASRLRAAPRRRLVAMGRHAGASAAGLALLRAYPARVRGAYVTRWRVAYGPARWR